MRRIDGEDHRTATRIYNSANIQLTKHNKTMPTINQKPNLHAHRNHSHRPPQQSQNNETSADAIIIPLKSIGTGSLGTCRKTERDSLSGLTELMDAPRFFRK